MTYKSGSILGYFICFCSTVNASNALYFPLKIEYAKITILIKIIGINAGVLAISPPSV